MNKASQDKDTLDVGANLFIGNLDPDVDEKVLTIPVRAHALPMQRACMSGAVTVFTLLMLRMLA